MDSKKIRAVGAGILVSIWAGLCVLAWFLPAKAVSESERRPLAQMPQITGQSVLDGKFMTEFGSFSLDQFPARDTFRRIKSLFHYNILRQKDNNGIYIADGYAAKLEYPLNEESVNHAIQRFRYVYETYLKESGSAVYFTAVPDKGYYLAEKNGYLAMDYEKMFAALRDGMPWAEFIDITGCLDVEDYYATDTHWRQEKLLGAAQKICQTMGVTPPSAEDYTITEIPRPFYGVYYGQAALPMDAERLYTMNSPLLDGCTVYNHETGKTTAVYDMEKRDGKDLYEVFLSGPQSLLTITNPNAKTDRELIVLRDSFGSSMVPLLVQDYKTVTLVDIRYMASALLGNFVDFHGQDVLFLYSTLVLNNSTTIK